MTNVFFMVVVFAILATCVNAQNPSCPSSSTVPCRCYTQSPGFRLECNGYYGPESIRDALAYYKEYGPIVSLSITDIQQSYFSYVPDNFLAGSLIPSVSFTCSHSHSVNDGILTFSALAFTDETGKCGLTGNLTIRDCNIRQFYAADLNNCNQLEKLAFMDSHVESILEIPTLANLKNVTVYYPQIWTGATQRGLSRFSLASGALLPRLRYLDLSGNSLKDNSIEFISRITTIEEIHLEGNLFLTVPVLTNSFDLHTFSITLSSSSDVSILLPDPRSQIRPLKASLYSSYTPVFNVSSLQGMFVGDDLVNLKLNISEFKEDVFLAPLQTNGLTINLNPSARILCACNITWLVRDNVNLLNRVKNGTCTDGRPFELIPPEEVACCSTESLINRVAYLQRENDVLKSKLDDNKFVANRQI